MIQKILNRLKQRFCKRALIIHEDGAIIFVNIEFRGVTPCVKDGFVVITPADDSFGDLFVEVGPDDDIVTD